MESMWDSKEKAAEWRKAYYAKNKERMLAQAKAWRERNRESHLADRKAARIANREKLALGQKSRYQELRAEVLKHLGDKCNHCGFSDPRALQIDHVLGGGRKEFQAMNGGGFTYLKKVLGTKPGEYYQCLCANCNWIKRHTNNEVAFPLVRFIRSR